MAIILARQSDPFKKYWWMILLLFGAVGLWVCYPALGGNAGLSIASAGSGLRPANQSLDPSANPNGAPGGPVNLSMDNSGPYRKKTSEDPFASLLFSPPPETSSPASPTTASSAAQKKSSWADALAQIAQRGAADAAPTAQIAAAFPTAKFGSLSGLSGSETSSAFSSGSVGPSRGLGAFGSAKPNIGISYTHGLSNSNSTPSSSQNSMAVLQNAAKTMKSALNSFNPSQAGAITSQVFDGGSLGNALIQDPKGLAAKGVGIQNTNGTPLSLKANDPALNSFHASPVPVTPPMPPQPSMAQQIMQMVMTALIGGIASAAGKALIGAFAL